MIKPAGPGSPLSLAYVYVHVHAFMKHWSQLPAHSTLGEEREGATLITVDKKPTKKFMPQFQLLLQP